MLGVNAPLISEHECQARLADAHARWRKRESAAFVKGTLFGVCMTLGMVFAVQAVLYLLT